MIADIGYQCKGIVIKKTYRLKKSKENWKTKAKARSSENSELRKKISRLEEKHLAEKSSYDRELLLLKKMAKESLVANTKNANATTWTTGDDSILKMKVLCIQIILVGIVSFRSVPRILGLLGKSIGVTEYPPHFTSVINWTLRAAIGTLENVAPIPEPWIAILDMSNSIGTQKILVVQRVLLSRLSEKGKAVCLQDAECVGIASNDIWNGDTVKTALTKIFKKAGLPAGLLKDGGSDLKKGARLFCEENRSKNIIIIDDVGHYVANALKAEYQATPDFKKFIEIIATGAKLLRQSSAAWAIPPKLRNKARFQGITKLAEWAQDIIFILEGEEKNICEKAMKLISKAYISLMELKPFLQNFILTCRIVESFLHIMKNQGLNKTTLLAAKKIISALPTQSLTRQRIAIWMAKHRPLHFQAGLGQSGLLVSSDIIESLFGKFKSIIARSPTSELNRLIYIIPILYGKPTDADLGAALASCSHLKMKTFLSKNVPLTIRQQRLILLKKETPNHRKNKGKKTA